MPLLNAHVEHSEVKKFDCLISEMLNITMVRYANDKVDGGGINESRTTELASQAVKLSLEFPTQDEVEAFECHPSICIGDLAYKKSSIGKKLMKRADMS